MTAERFVVIELVYYIPLADDEVLFLLKVCIKLRFNVGGLYDIPS